MTNRERFAVKICNATQKTNFACKEAKCVGKGLCAYCYTMADHLLANGVILPPCKVGDTVYTIFEGDIEALKIIYAKTEESTESIRKYYDAENKFLKMPFADCHIGKSIFLTKEEAEEKLKECEG